MTQSETRTSWKVLGMCGMIYTFRKPCWLLCCFVNNIMREAGAEAGGSAGTTQYRTPPKLDAAVVFRERKTTAEFTVRTDLEVEGCAYTGCLRADLGIFSCGILLSPSRLCKQRSWLSGKTGCVGILFCHVSSPASVFPSVE